MILYEKLGQGLISGHCEEEKPVPAMTLPYQPEAAKESQFYLQIHTGNFGVLIYVISYTKLFNK